MNGAIYQPEDGRSGWATTLRTRLLTPQLGRVGSSLLLRLGSETFYFALGFSLCGVHRWKQRLPSAGVFTHDPPCWTRRGRNLHDGESLLCSHGNHPALVAGDPLLGPDHDGYALIWIKTIRFSRHLWGSE
jgi:hypothetical protein